MITLGQIPVEWVHAFVRLQTPVNSTNHFLSFKGMEIGVARNQAVEWVLKVQPRPRYIVFLSDDDLPSWDGLVKLWMAMENDNQWDLLSSLVHLKAEPPTPVLWRKGKDGALEAGKDYNLGDIVETDVANLGFALMRPELFEEISSPWFRTGFLTKELSDGREGVILHTEDTWFFSKMKDKGKKIGVHTGVRSGHIDSKTGVIY